MGLFHTGPSPYLECSPQAAAPNFHERIEKHHENCRFPVYGCLKQTNQRIAGFVGGAYHDWLKLKILNCS